MSERYAKYENFTTVLVEEKQEGIAFLNRFIDFITSFSGSVENFVAQFNPILAALPFKKDAKSNLPKVTKSTMIHSNLGNVFVELSGAPFLHLPILNMITHDVKDSTIFVIKNILQSFESSMNELISKSNNSIQTYQDVLRKYTTLHAEYMNYGQQLQQCEPDSKKRKKLIDKFNKAKAAALAAHNTLSEAADQFGIQMEYHLNDLEKINLSIHNQLEVFVNQFVSQLDGIAYKFLRSNNDTINMVSEISVDNEMNSIKSTTNVIYPEADDTLSPYAINTGITHILPASFLYPWIDKSQVFRVLKDQEGAKHMLAVKANDLVVRKDTKNNMQLCTTVNGAVGYIPTSNLISVE